MPQLDKFIFFSQYFWFFLLFFGLYLLLVGSVLPSLLRSLKGRRLLRSSLQHLNGRLQLLGDSLHRRQGATLSSFRSLLLQRESALALRLASFQGRRDVLLRSLLGDPLPLWFPPSSPGHSPSPFFFPLLLAHLSLRRGVLALATLLYVAALVPPHPSSPPSAPIASPPAPLLLLWALHRYGRLVSLLRGVPPSPLPPPLFPIP